MTLAVARMMLMFGAFWTSSGYADSNVYYQVDVARLELVSGSLPVAAGDGTYATSRWDALFPAVLLDGEGEAFFVGVDYAWDWPATLTQNGSIVVRVPKARDVTGRLYMPDGPIATMIHVEFRIPANLASTGASTARTAFLGAKAQHYQRLVGKRYPGTAWFRRQAAEAARLLDPNTKTAADDTTLFQQNPNAGDELSDTFELFTGNRALAENLQLDRVLRVNADTERVVDVGTLQGITVDEIDWRPLNKDARPKVDSLAGLVPFDQYALFFRSFSDMTTLTDEADRDGTPVLAWFDERTEDGMTKQRYQEQLCLPVSTVARLLGPAIVNSLAFTGSDPFLRLGSDVAVIFDASNPALLEQHVTTRQAEALSSHSTAKKVSGQAGSLAYTGVVTPDRTVSSYLARAGKVVIVSNSLHQIEAIAATQAGKIQSMAQLGEYTFFRERYKITDADETALLIVTDASIRKWCSAKWRIADSRRIRALAAMTDFQARNVTAIFEGRNIGKPVPDSKDAVQGDSLTFAHAGVFSPTFGTLRFLTPIAEMKIDRVTQAEADAYTFFRNRYQSSWRAWFDPIAVRFFVSEHRVTADLTVMPLIAGTEYRDLVDLTEGQIMKPDSGDPHSDTLMRWAIALNPSSQPIRQAASFALTMMPGMTANPLDWIGESVTLYADKDQFWSDMVAAPKNQEEKFFESNLHRLPLALRVAVKSPLKATAFMAAFRAWVDTTAPGMTLWETLNHQGQPYVRVSSKTSSGDADGWKDLAIFYSLSADALDLTLSEPVMKRAMERRARRAAGKQASTDKCQDWAGGSVAVQADGYILDLIDRYSVDEYRSYVLDAAWGNLYILNEWKRLFPDKDPVEVHRTLWHTDLTDPAGGKYVWDEKNRTMSSTVAGSPLAAGSAPGLKHGPLATITHASLGITFENDGLRARADLER